MSYSQHYHDLYIDIQNSTEVQFIQLSREPDLPPLHKDLQTALIRRLAKVNKTTITLVTAILKEQGFYDDLN